MKNNHTIEIIIAFVLIALLILLSNPYNIFMPSMFQMFVSALAVIVFGFFASVVVKERAHDEREAVHRSLAGRIAFLCGSLVLLVGIVYQTFHHNLDIWLVTALVAMVVAKASVRIHTDRYQ
jgi:fatty acid desaturase